MLDSNLRTKGLFLTPTFNRGLLFTLSYNLAHLEVISSYLLWPWLERQSFLTLSNLILSSHSKAKSTKRKGFLLKSKSLSSLEGSFKTKGCFLITKFIKTVLSTWFKQLIYRFSKIQHYSILYLIQENGIWLISTKDRANLLF